MTFIQGVAGDGFYVTMGCGIQAEAKKLGNVTTNTQGPSKFDATLQNPIIESVTAAKPDAILVASNDVSASLRPDRRGHGRRSEHPLITLGGSPKSGVALTMPRSLRVSTRARSPAAALAAASSPSPTSLARRGFLPRKVAADLTDVIGAVGPRRSLA